MSESTPARDPSPPELERRVIDLEVRAAFQAQTIEALDGVVREFATRVEVLERTLAELRAQLAASESWQEDIEPA
jgi:uncharacterized coiled-coil protein SlyX